MELRDAATEDLDRLIPLYRDSVLRLGPAHYTAEEVHAWAHAMRRDKLDALLANGRIVLVTQDDILGFGAYHDGHLELLYVHPDHTRKGIGQRIYDTLEATARSQGAERITLDASKISKPFFARNGYRSVADTERPTCGVRLLCTRMEKSLG